MTKAQKLILKREKYLITNYKGVTQCQVNIQENCS